MYPPSDSIEVPRRVFTSAPFWTCFAAVWVLAQLLPADAERRRAALLTAAGLAVAIVILELPRALIALLLLAVAWLVVTLRLAAGAGRERPFQVGLALFAPILGLWVLGKQSAAFEGPFAWLYFAGFSYFLVKAWTLIKDTLDGRVEPAPAVCVAAYFLHFPTYLSGPMHYFHEFRGALREPLRLDASGWLEVAYRFALGLFKVELLARLLAPASLQQLVEPSTASAGQLALASIAYWGVLYWDFSGYSDMAIATSRALGVPAPENFDRPYLAPSLREFWQRWHMSFTRVLTAYVFLPTTRVLQQRIGLSRPMVTAGGYVAAFGFCGYWHGPTANFVAWGLYHAAGLIANDRFRTWSMQRRRERRLPPRQGAAALAVRGLGVAGTFAFVSLGWILFALPLEALF